MPRARLLSAGGTTTEWQNKTLPAYRRRTKEVDALIAGAYLAGTNTRRVSRALAGLFQGAVSKSTVSRVWRRIKADWDAWNARDLAGEDIVRLILDGTVVKVRLDRKATSITLLVVLGARGIRFAVFPGSGLRRKQPKWVVAAELVGPLSRRQRGGGSG